MEHSFSVEIATKLGINQAILLNNIAYWTRYNEANKINFHDGHYWTFNSTKSFSELFPYMTKRQVNYALKSLIDDGYIVTGNYNEHKYDRTLWYALTDLGKSILQNCQMHDTKLSNANDTDEKSILQNCQMEDTNLSNAFDTDVTPIPNINTNNKPYINTNKKKSVKTDIVYDEDPDVNQAIKDYIAYRKEIKVKMTDRAIELMLKRLNELGSTNTEKIAIINQSIERGWKGLFELKDDSNDNAKKTSQNKFNQFPQRQYSATDYSSLEQKLLNKS